MAWPVLPAAFSCGWREDADSREILAVLHNYQLQPCPFWGIMNIDAKGSRKDRRSAGTAKGELSETESETQQVYVRVRHDRQGYGLFHGEHVSDLLSYGHY